jgi:hypothetical protein
MKLLFPLYIHIPKNAGISIKSVLIKEYNYSKKLLGHLTCQQLKARANLDNYKYNFIFTSVRNPYTRMLSIYFFLKEKMKNYTHYNLKMDLTIPFKVYSFKHFVNHFLLNDEKNFHYMNTYMFLPQKTWLDTNDNVEIFKIEEIVKLEKILNNKLQFFNKLDYIRDLKHYYDQDTKKIVFRNFEIDFDIFKYPSVF